MLNESMTVCSIIQVLSTLNIWIGRISFDHYWSLSFSWI